MCKEKDFDEPAGRRGFLRSGLALGALGLVGTGLGGTGAWAADKEAAFAGRDIDFPTKVGRVKGYLAMPGKPGRHPGVVVLHTTRFSQPDSYRMVADELARTGFVALSVARYSRVPGFTQEMLEADEKGPQRFRGNAYFSEEMEEARGAVDWLARHRAVEGDRIGAVGFCGGGMKAMRMAIDTPKLGAAVSFYGPTLLPARFKKAGDPVPDLVDQASRVRAPLQMHYGTDDYVVKGPDQEAFAAAVRGAGVAVETYAYEGAKHGFYDPLDPQALKSAADLARDRYLRFLHQHLC